MKVQAVSTFFSVLLITVLVLTGCAAGTTQPTPTAVPGSNQAPKVIESSLQREMNVQITSSEQQSLADGNRAFAVDLYHQLAAGSGNLIFSPFSISLAMAMVDGGAAGETASQINSAMHFTLPPDQLHPSFNALDAELESTSTAGITPEPTSTDQSGQDFQLDIANSIWGQQGFDFLQSYLDLLAKNYGAGLQTVDFESAPESARLNINDWVSQKTAGKIQDLFPQGSITQATRLVLANAIYFKASWFEAFDPQATRDGPFTLNDGSTVTVPMMTSTKTAKSYTQGDGFQAVALPYQGRSEMVVVLPDSGKFDSFEAGLNSANLENIFQSLSETPVNLTMPKFTIESSFSLNQTLETLGMKDAFDKSLADFSGMDGQRDLFISDVVHKAYVAVDESGTEAAAATGIVMTSSAMMTNPVEVKIDHPFLFFIYDDTTDTILFAGRVLNPAG